MKSPANPKKSSPARPGRPGQTDKTGKASAAPRPKPAKPAGRPAPAKPAGAAARGRPGKPGQTGGKERPPEPRAVAQPQPLYVPLWRSGPPGAGAAPEAASNAVWDAVWKALWKAVDEVMPLSAAQRRDLPYACRDLSALLTTERAERGPYWSSPRLLSAYLRYFLPWNLVRLAALLPVLPLGDAPERPRVLDAGSGPLTLPLALWLFRPELRALPVELIASDTAPHPMDVGRRVFEQVRSALDPASRWTVRCVRASALSAVRKSGAPWLVTLGNVLNEMEDRPGRRPADSHGEGALFPLAEALGATLEEGGLVLAVEPGTRQGGRMISALRAAVLETSDAAPLLPCPHAGPCPLAGRGMSAWCHMRLPTEAAPEALARLSRAAGLDKESVSLSFALLGGRVPRDPAFPGALAARLISDPFALPGYPGRARYACTEKGLGLLPDAARLPSGALCRVETAGGRDAKSGALLLRVK